MTERDVVRFAYLPLGAKFFCGPAGTVEFTKIDEDRASTPTDHPPFRFALDDKCYPASPAERPETHTPLPEISSEEGAFWIAKVATHDDGFVEGKHNADFIVTACNNYAALKDSWDETVTALKFAKEIIDDQAERLHKDCRCQLCESAPMLIDAALTNAKALAEKMK